VCDYFTDAQLKHEYAKIKLNATHRVHNVTVAWLLESIKQEQRLDENLFAPAGLGWTHGADIRKLLGSSGSGRAQGVQEAEGSSSSAASAHASEDAEAASSSSSSSSSSTAVAAAPASSGSSTAGAVFPSDHPAPPAVAMAAGTRDSSREQHGRAVSTVQLSSKELGASHEVELTASQVGVRIT
jgi:hypothetical protein